jgi:hypothetical protein
VTQRLAASQQLGHTGPRHCPAPTVRGMAGEGVFVGYKPTCIQLCCCKKLPCCIRSE